LRPIEGELGHHRHLASALPSRLPLIPRRPLRGSPSGRFLSVFLLLVCLLFLYPGRDQFACGRYCEAAYDRCSDDDPPVNRISGFVDPLDSGQ
jgi:hypothetical protein